MVLASRGPMEPSFHARVEDAVTRMQPQMSAGAEALTRALLESGISSRPVVARLPFEDVLR